MAAINDEGVSTPLRGKRTRGGIGQGVRLTSQTKTIIGNVFNYFQRLHRQGRGDGPYQRTADATKISTVTIRKIISERDKLQGQTAAQQVIEGQTSFDSPRQRYGRSRKRVTPDRFDKETIRRLIYDFYEQKQHVTVTKLLKTVRDRELFSGGKTLLRQLLHDIGFKYRRVDDRRYYYEQPHITEQRKIYLRRMKQNRADNRPVVFLDETWANAHDGKDLAWVEDDTVTGGTLGGIRRPSGKGKRLIILGAGGEMGWIPNTTLIFQSKKNTGDYHDEMTGEHFEEWFRNSLLPNVPPHSLIVMDNASYHSRIEEEIPKKSWTKCKMISWLVYYGIEFFDDDCTKSQLFSIVQDAAKRMGVTNNKYIVDEMALKAGYEVVRLPVAHCTLNPIELAWAQVKGHIKANTSKFTLDEVKSLAKEGFEVVTKERWADLVKHVRDKVEDHYWQNDNLDLDERFRISEFVIHVGSESDDASSELDSASDSNICLGDAVAAIDGDGNI